MRPLSMREKRIFLLCQLAVAAFLCDILVIKPVTRQDGSLREEILRQERQLAENEDVIRRYDAIKEGYGHYLIKFKQTKPDAEQVSAILSSLDRVAKKFEIHISDVKPGKVKKESLHNTFMVDLSMSGDLIQIFRFIHFIENAPYLFDIDTFHFERQSRRENLIECRLSLSRIMIP